MIHLIKEIVDIELFKIIGLARRLQKPVTCKAKQVVNNAGFI